MRKQAGRRAGTGTKAKGVGRIPSKAGHGKERAAALRATQRLEREIARRKAAEKTLGKHERRYAALLASSLLEQQHFRRLSHTILFAQENERKRISRELHDEIGQTLTGISMLLDRLTGEGTLDAKELKRKIASTQRLVGQSMVAIHRFARELRPPLLDDMGLIPALHAYMKSFTKRTGIRVNFKALAEVERLDNAKRTTLFRVAQEALANVVKHARATLVQVSIERDKAAVRMEVTDNGKSFQVKRVMFPKTIKRLGLLGMRERVEMVGGKFAVESAPSKGTTVRTLIPFGSRPNRARDHLQRVACR